MLFFRRCAATIFGQLWRLEPLPPEKKAMWRREMDWLLCISDHIVELVPTWQSFPDGTRLEVQYQPTFQPVLVQFSAYGCSRPAEITSRKFKTVDQMSSPVSPGECTFDY